MIRIRESDGWLLIKHPDHARLAGEFASCWGNERFYKPEPVESTLIGVTRHDDAWETRDSSPEITKEGLPSAFSKELVGTYDAFEEIDFCDYLAVSGQATETVASVDPYAAILVSMHTVNLLTEQADLSTLNEAERDLHTAFIEGQRSRQKELADTLKGDGETHTGVRNLQKGFEFLQACDSLSLICCVRYDTTLPLRHKHPDHSGNLHEIVCEPKGSDCYELTPYPFGENPLKLNLRALRIRGDTYEDHSSLRESVRFGESINIGLQFVAGGDA